MELEINRQTGATYPVMQMQDCHVAAAEAFNLPVHLCSNPQLYSQALGNDQQNEAIDASS